MAGLRHKPRHNDSNVGDTYRQKAVGRALRGLAEALMKAIPSPTEAQKAAEPAKPSPALGR